MGVATTTTAPVEQVDDLIRQVADEAGLDIAAQVVSHVMMNIPPYLWLLREIISKLINNFLQLASVPTAEPSSVAATATATGEQDALSKRLAALRE